MTRPKNEDSLRGCIQRALISARKMIGREKYDAAFSNKTKDEITLYVCTWIIPPLARALQKTTRYAKQEKSAGDIPLLEEGRHLPRGGS